MGKSIQDLEREIEESRARLDGTIEDIQDRLTVSGMVDEFFGGASAGSVSTLFDRVLDTARRHPAPLLIAAVGVGLILQRFGAKRLARRERGADAAYPIDRRPIARGPQAGAKAASDLAASDLATGPIADGRR